MDSSKLFENVLREATILGRTQAERPIKSFIKGENYNDLGSIRVRDGYINVSIFAGEPLLVFDGVWRYPNRKVWLTNYCADDGEKEELLNMNWLEAIADFTSDNISVEELSKGVSNY